MKRYLRLLPVVLLALALCACGCKHETWNEANCETPKTCANCGEIEGAPLGHTWLPAACETARICENCGKTNGEALGHSWAEADCETAKTCTVCGKTEGEALGHSWEEATCETVKTCTICGKTEGEVPGHSWVDATFDTPKTCTACGKTEGEALSTDAAETYTCRELTMFVPEGMSDVSGQSNLSNFTFALDSAKLAIFGLNETFAEYPELEEYSTKDYADLIVEVYQVNGNTAQRTGKNYHYIIYTAETTQGEFTYMAGIFKNSTGFWMVQICSATEDYNEQLFFAYMDSVNING